ncbi:MAG TPA: hypothetical protein VGU45_17445 [Microvirga sp.]|jgi:hypothetical protein|nr:hypothetical protein [Microvirga sp.]
MNFLICIRSYWYFKNTAPLLLEALRRGNRVVLMVTSKDVSGLTERDRIAAEDVEIAIGRLKAEYPLFSVLRAPEREDWWLPFVNSVRRALDLVHLMNARFDTKPRLRKRAIDRAPRTMSEYLMRVKATGDLDTLASRLRRLDDRIPPERQMVRLLREAAPDVIMVTPLIDLGCNQNEILRAARFLRIPTLFAVHSWDNLSMKSRIRVRPTRIVVWNALQRKEAVEYHGIPAEHVAISGAPHFDDWHNNRPKRTRARFLMDAGLDPDAPLITYLCSTVFDFQRLREQDFVKRWITALRQSGDKLLERANVLVRVHPQRVHMAAEFGCPGDPRVVVWPKNTTAPVGTRAKDDYLSSLTFADAVVGINTTGMVEAAFLERPVLTILGTEFADSQDGTFHFAYLTNNGKGMIRTAASMSEHLQQLARAVGGDQPFTTAERDYVRMFVRSQGDISSTSRLLEVLESTALCETGPQARLGTNLSLGDLSTLGFIARLQAVDLGRRGLSHVHRKAEKLLRFTWRFARSSARMIIIGAVALIVHPSSDRAGQRSQNSTIDQ